MTGLYGEVIAEHFRRPRNQGERLLAALRTPLRPSRISCATLSLDVLRGAIEPK